MTEYAIDTADEFRPREAVAAVVNLANATRDTILANWRRVYDAFWMVPRVYDDRARTMEQQQAFLDADPVVYEMLSDSAAFLLFARKHYAESFGEGNTIEPRYLSAPYEFEMDGDRIVLKSLKPEWDIDDGQPDETDETDEEEDSEPAETADAAE